MRKLILLLLITSKLYGQNYYPDKIWIEKKPESLGINSNSINIAIQFAKNNENSVEKDIKISIIKSFGNEPFFKIKGPTKIRGNPNGLIIKNGYIIGKWGDTKRVDMTFSVTKSYLSTIAGIAYDYGLIKLNDKVHKYIQDEKFDSEHNRKITWHHLLNQSSEWSGILFGTYDWADRPQKNLMIEELKNQKLKLPGSNYKYNDVRVNLLSYSLLNIFKKPLPKILKEKIMDPIGATNSWKWYGYKDSKINIDGTEIESVSGGGHFGGGMFINSEDHARFGLLFLRNGMWKNRRLISSNWIKKIQVSSENNESYGYMWWLNKGDRKWNRLPENIYYASGFGGNYIIIIPDSDLVIVARWIDSSKIREFIKLVIESHINIEPPAGIEPAT